MPQWRRTLYTVWFTQFIAVAGFSFVLPFILAAAMFGVGAMAVVLWVQEARRHPAYAS